MATTFTWSIDWMQASTQVINGFDEVVLNAGWRCSATDGTNPTYICGSVSFPKPSEGGEFTPYADLTLEQVLSWIHQNGVDKTSTEASIAQQLEAIANPPTIMPPLPWAN